MASMARGGGKGGRERTSEGRDSLLKFAAGKASEKIARKPKLDSGRSNISRKMQAPCVSSMRLTSKH